MLYARALVVVVVSSPLGVTVMVHFQMRQPSARGSVTPTIALQDEQINWWRSAVASLDDDVVGVEG